MPSGTISALQVQASDSQRINLFINGTFALGISFNTLVREKLYVGQELSAEDFARLEQAEQYDHAIRVAVAAIESRPRSSAELRIRLQRKGFPPEIITPALERLTEIGLVDDQQFARFWVESRQRGRPRGSSALRDELRRKGVANTVIQATLSDSELVGDAHSQAEQVARAAMRKYHQIQDYPTFQRRLGGFLQRRGFPHEIVRVIVTKLWAEQGRNTDQET